MGYALIQDTHRNFILKIVAGSIALSGVWFSVVGPKLTAFEDAKYARQAQTNEIAEGEQAVEQFSMQVDASMARIQALQHDLGIQLDLLQEVDVHKHLQDTAEAYQLTVSRIEPLRDTTTKRASSVEGGLDITMQTREFRIECVGAYDGVVKYLQSLSQSTNLSKVSSFRVVPVSGDHARMILQVEVYSMNDAPKALTESLASASLKLTDAGASNE